RFRRADFPQAVAIEFLPISVHHLRIHCHENKTNFPEASARRRRTWAQSLQGLAVARFALARVASRILRTGHAPGSPKPHAAEDGRRASVALVRLLRPAHPLAGVKLARLRAPALERCAAAGMGLLTLSRLRLGWRAAQSLPVDRRA